MWILNFHFVILSICSFIFLLLFPAGIGFTGVDCLCIRIRLLTIINFFIFLFRVPVVSTLSLIIFFDWLCFVASLQLLIISFRLCMAILLLIFLLLSIKRRHVLR